MTGEDHPRNPYAQVLRFPGAKAFVATGVLARFDLAMTSLGIILMVNGHGGSFVRATILTGAYALSSAICAPRISRLTDRLGQHTMLPRQASCYLLAVLGLIISVQHDGPWWLPVGFGALAGAANPMVTSMVRARWSHLCHGSSSVRTAFAMESMIDAAIIAVGAPLATFLATFLFPTATLLFAVCTGTVSAGLLATQRRTEPPCSVRATDDGKNSFIPPNLPLILTVLFFVGVYLASFDVTTIAIALDAGQPQLGGWILAVYAVGSTIGGAVVGHLTGSTERLLYAALALLAVAVAPMMFVQDTLPRLALGFAAGLGVAPTILLAITLVEELTSPRRLTEALAWTSSALVTGTATGQVLAGHAADWFGGYPGYGVTLSGAVLGLGTALARSGFRTRAGQPTRR